MCLVIVRSLNIRPKDILLPFIGTHKLLSSCPQIKPISSVLVHARGGYWDASVSLCLSSKILACARQCAFCCGCGDRYGYILSRDSTSQSIRRPTAGESLNTAHKLRTACWAFRNRGRILSWTKDLVTIVTIKVFGWTNSSSMFMSLPYNSAIDEGIQAGGLLFALSTRTFSMSPVIPKKSCSARKIYGKMLYKCLVTQRHG